MARKGRQQEAITAPAMLTVGSMEYQLGRIDEATTLFHGLLKLPTDTPDQEIIIDKAGDYLESARRRKRSLPPP